MTAIAWFVVGLLGFLLGFGFLIYDLARRFKRRIPRRLYRRVEALLIGAIILGIAGMFQPWLLGGFRWGFILLFYSTLAFIVWNHLTPRPREGKKSNPPQAVDPESTPG